MGMYDYVDFEQDCPICHAKIAGFQSKDKGCQLELYKPDEVSRFYAQCHKCKLWVEYERPRPPRSTEDD